MRKLRLFTSLLGIASWLALALFSSCELTSEEITTDQSAKLSFSTDTVFFDTVFTGIGSITKRIVARNPNKKALVISDIRLSDNSPYKLTVQGVPGNQAKDVKIFGGDSILILVKITIDPKNQNTPFVVRDSVQFTTNGNRQNVQLVSWGQDAHYLRDSILPCNSVWVADKPYVIFDDILIDTLCKLTIEQGVKIYLSPGSDIFVRGALDVRGTPDKRVAFTSIRQDERYKNSPGQWGGIVFLRGSTGSTISGADIRNGTFGLYSEARDTDNQTDLLVEQTIIENIAVAGLQCIDADVTVVNSLIDNCITHTVSCIGGGNYTFVHNTFANFGFNFFRENPSVQFSNYVELSGGETVIHQDLRINLVNNIIYGSLDEEWELANTAGKAFDVLLQNNIIRQNRVAVTPQQSTNTNPKFKDARRQLFALDTLSPAKDAGFLTNIANDLLGKPRDNKPDIGAYERKEK